MRTIFIVIMLLAMCGVFLGIQRGAQYQANMAMLISAISELRGESGTDAKDLEMLASRASVHARASVKNQLMISCLIIGLGLLGAMLRTPQEIKSVQQGHGA